MSLPPQLLLSEEARKRCVFNLKTLPAFMFKDDSPSLSAAVLVPVCAIDEEVHILYTLRSSNLRKHSGQVSFPGGKKDGDESIVDTALRETEEEIGFPRHSVDVWCEMPSFNGPNKEMRITPVVGVLRNFNVNKLQANLSEVEEIFTVSIQTLCDVNNHAYVLSNGTILPVFYSGKHNIWGMTGYITHLFLQSFLPENVYNPDFTRKQYQLDELYPSKI